MKKLNFSILVILFLVTFSFRAKAQFSILQNFDSLTGQKPYGDLISDGTFLYGMTYTGGSTNGGTIFKILPNGTGYNEIHDFATFQGGFSPKGSLYYDGTFLYGMTQSGGTNNKGIIFKIMPDGTGFIKLLDFAGANGDLPLGSLISDGTFLYGETHQGGLNNQGCIFKIMPNGTGYVDIHDFSFSSTDGKAPNGALYFDGTFLYGLTYAGGSNDNGIIFKIMPDGTGFSDMHDFIYGTDGLNPNASLISDGTYLYGTTSFGGLNSFGSVFKIMPNGNGYSTIYSFSGASDGSEAEGSLIYDGTFLYGMTEYGGANNFGVIFKMMPNGTGFSNLYDLTSGSGNTTSGSLIIVGNYLYGMAPMGGANSLGTIFGYQYSGTGISSVEDGKQIISVYPNPFQETTEIFLPNNCLGNSNEIILSDMEGRIVRKEEISGIRSYSFMRGNLDAGIYFCSLISDGKVVGVTKIVAD